jgi:hypothetical protein
MDDGLKKLTRSKRKLLVSELLSTSSTYEILDEVGKLPGLKRVVVISQSDSGDEIYYNFNVRAVIYQLELMKSKLVNDLLYPDDDEEEDE